MNVLEVIINIKKDSEVQEIYDTFMDNDREIEARLLRTKYIRSKALSPEKIEWTEVLKYFVLEEKVDLYKEEGSDFYIKDDAKLEFQNSELPVSRMNAFLLASLAKVQPEVFLINRTPVVLSLESSLLTRAFEKRSILYYILDLYVMDSYAAKYVVRQAAELIERISESFGFLASEMEKSQFTIEPFERKFELEYELKLADKEAVEDDSLRYGAIYLSMYFWANKEPQKAITYLEKAMLVTNPADYIYDILLFLKSEII